MAVPSRSVPFVFPWIYYARYALFMTGLIVLLHLVFSGVGYNPTDDGFNLAYSRRLLEGEVPHRDFISIRPVGTPLFHALFVLWGGEYTYLISRLFVIAQMVVFSWLWLQILKRHLQISLSFSYECLILVLGSLCGLGFPQYAWYTTDGLFFGTLGVAVWTFFPQRKFWAYFLIGFAVLCKQNFVFFALGAPFLLKEYKKWTAWCGMALPGVLYLAYLAYFHALTDFLIQITSHTSWLDVGIKPYLHYFCWLPLAGALGLCLLRKKSPEAISFLFSGLVLLEVSLCAISISLGRLIPPGLSSLGMALGAILAFLFFTKEKEALLVQWGLILVLLNWAGAISISGPFPHHSWGSLILFLLLVSEAIAPGGRKLRIAQGATFLLAIAFISYGRMTFLGREKPMNRCTYALDGIFPGCSGIKTNENTFSFLVDLQEAIGKVQDRYVILPDIPGYWVQSKKRNPLPMDWIQRLELHHPKVLERMKSVFLEEIKRKTKFIIQKIESNSLATAAFPEPLHLSDLHYGFNQFVHFYDQQEDPRYAGNYGLTLFVKDRCQKIDETKYFEIYTARD